MTDVINEAQAISRQAQGAAERYENNVASLYREDGQQIFSDAEHGMLEESYRNERDQAFAELTQKAERLEQQAVVTREAMAGSEPIDYFDMETIQEAGARREFVREEAEGLDLPALTARIKRAAHAGSSAVAYLYQRYGSRRHAEELNLLRDNGGGDVEASAQLTELQDALDALREKAVPAQLADDQRRAQQAVEAVMEARQVVDRAGLTDNERRQRTYSPW